MTRAQRTNAILAEIGAERERQVNVEGWTEAHDDKHDDFQIAQAAACYAVDPKAVHVAKQLNSSRGIDSNSYAYDHSTPKPGQIDWPWASGWYKPRARRRNLVRAGALIVAELERLDRLEGETP